VTIILVMILMSLYSRTSKIYLKIIASEILKIRKVNIDMQNKLVYQPQLSANIFCLVFNFLGVLVSSLNNSTWNLCEYENIDFKRV
jgi:hypothetical protein